MKELTASESLRVYLIGRPDTVTLTRATAEALVAELALRERLSREWRAQADKCLAGWKRALRGWAVSLALFLAALAVAVVEFVLLVGQ